MSPFLVSLGLWNYWLVVVLMMVGLYLVIAKGNLVKKLMGLNIFQGAVIMLYVSMGKVSGGTAPIFIESSPGELAEGIVYSNPLPHVLMLTAIVVGVATTAVGLALAVRIREAYGTVEEDDVTRIQRLDELHEIGLSARDALRELGSEGEEE